MTSENVEKARDANGRRSILRDVVVSIAITLAITAPVWFFIGSVQGAAMWLLIPFAPILPFLLFGAPFAVAFYGFAMLSAGFFLGPLLLVGVVCAVAVLYMRAGDSAVHAFATQSLEPASRPHNVLMMGPGIGACESECARVLVSSSYTVAHKADLQSKGWRLFRRGEGDVCLAQDQRQSATVFAALGFQGMCAIQSSVPEVRDGLLLRVRHLARGKATDVPAAYAGSVYEIIERTDGRDRLLGRRLEGVVILPIPQAVSLFVTMSLGFASEQQVDLGPRIVAEQFLATASKTPADRPFGG